MQLHHANNCNKSEEQKKAELEVESGYVNLFGLNSSQSQNNPPSPPPRCRKRFLEERHEVDDKDEDEDKHSGNDNRGRGSKAEDTAAMVAAERSAKEGFSIGVSS